MKREDGPTLLKRVKDYIWKEVIPVLGPGVVSKNRLEDFIQETQLPGWFDALTSTSRRQLLTRAMDLIGHRWSDSAWVVDQEPVLVQGGRERADTARRH